MFPEEPQFTPSSLPSLPPSSSFPLPPPTAVSQNSSCVAPPPGYLHPPDIRIQPSNGCNSLIKLQPERPAGDHGRNCRRSWSSIRGDPGAENVSFSCIPPVLFVPSAKFPSLARLFCRSGWYAYGLHVTLDPQWLNHQVVQSRPDRSWAGP